MVIRWPSSPVNKVSEHKTIHCCPVCGGVHAHEGWTPQTFLSNWVGLEFEYTDMVLVLNED